jgi:hypothetical protein
MFVKSPLKFDPTKNPLTRPKIEKPQKNQKCLTIQCQVRVASELENKGGLTSSCVLLLKSLVR